MEDDDDDDDNVVSGSGGHGGVSGGSRSIFAGEEIEARRGIEEKEEELVVDEEGDEAEVEGRCLGRLLLLLQPVVSSLRELLGGSPALDVAFSALLCWRTCSWKGQTTTQNLDLPRKRGQTCRASYHRLDSGISLRVHRLPVLYTV